LYPLVACNVKRIYNRVLRIREIVRKYRCLP